MMCKTCSSAIRLGQITRGKCSICDGTLYSPHTPAYTICDKCAWINRLCQQCGEKIEEGKMY